MIPVVSFEDPKVGGVLAGAAERDLTVPLDPHCVSLACVRGGDGV